MAVTGALWYLQWQYTHNRYLSLIEIVFTTVLLFNSLKLDIICEAQCTVWLIHAGIVLLPALFHFHFNGMLPDWSKQIRIIIQLATLSLSVLIKTNNSNIHKMFHFRPRTCHCWTVPTQNVFPLPQARHVFHCLPGDREGRVREQDWSSLEPEDHARHRLSKSGSRVSKHGENFSFNSTRCQHPSSSSGNSLHLSSLCFQFTRMSFTADPSDTIQTLDERWDAGWSVSKEARTEKNLISIKQVQGSCLQQPGSDHTTLLSSLSFDYFREDLKEEDIQSARHLQLGRVQRREQSISQSIDDCYTRHKISTVSPYTGPHCANSHQTEFHQEVKRCNVDLSEPKYLILFL